MSVYLVEGLIGLLILVIYSAYSIGYMRGHSAGIDYGSKALKEYGDHVTQRLRDIRL